MGKTESEYRKIVMDSSSSLKDFDTDRRKYYKKYILSERVEEKDNQAINIGKLVELLLLEPDLFDQKFYLSTCTKKPTGLMELFVEALYEGVMNNGGVMDGEIMRGAYVQSGFKIKFETVVEKFTGSDAEIFYQELVNVRKNGMTVVTVDDVTNAERIVEELKTNPITADIFNTLDGENYSVYNQYQIQGYEVDEHLFKSMMDKQIC